MLIIHGELITLLLLVLEKCPYLLGVKKCYLTDKLIIEDLLYLFAYSCLITWLMCNEKRIST